MAVPRTARTRLGDRRQAKISLVLVAACILAVVIDVAVLVPAQTKPAPDKGFFDYPLEATLMLSTFVTLIAVGLWAAVTLVRRPLESSLGRWAMRLAAICIGLTPAIAIVAQTLGLFGVQFPEDWGQPFVPLWVGSGAGAIACGAFAPGERERGLLMVPLMLGALALTFSLGEVLAPH